MDVRDLVGTPLRVTVGIASRATLAAVDVALASRLAVEIVDRVLASEALEHVLASAQAAAVPQRVIDSRLVDEFVDRLLQSEELWLLVDEIARSPAVTDAIGTQGIGFADQIAGVVRDRSRTADARMERVARRLLRRRPETPPVPAVQPG